MDDYKDIWSFLLQQFWVAEGLYGLRLILFMNKYYLGEKVALWLYLSNWNVNIYFAILFTAGIC